MCCVCSCDRQCTRALDECKCKYIIIIVSSGRHRVSRKFAVCHNVLDDFALIFFIHFKYISIGNCLIVIEMHALASICKIFTLTRALNSRFSLASNQNSITCFEFCAF